MKRDPNTLPCNPVSPVSENACSRIMPGNMLQRRDLLHVVAQTVWADGEDENNMGYERGVAYEAELKERLEALLCTLDRYNDL